MKKIKLIFGMILCVLLSVNCLAVITGETVYKYDNGTITVVFSADSEFSSEEQKEIADMLVYGKNTEGGYTTYSLCWLTGHDLTTNSVSRITHTAKAQAPRCKEEIFLVSKCNKCDYIETELFSETYFNCCPEE